MFCATWQHNCVPISRGIAKRRHDFLDLWSSCFLVIPTLLDQAPQGVGDPDSFCIRRFLRAKAAGYAVCELQGFDIAKWLSSCQDLTERQETRRRRLNSTGT